MPCKSAGNILERGVQGMLGGGGRGKADQATILPNLTISITYSHTADKATNQINFKNYMVKGTMIQIIVKKISIMWARIQTKIRLKSD